MRTLTAVLSAIAIVALSNLLIEAVTAGEKASNGVSTASKSITEEYERQWQIVKDKYPLIARTYMLQQSELMRLIYENPFWRNPKICALYRNGAPVLNRSFWNLHCRLIQCTSCFDRYQDCRSDMDEMDVTCQAEFDACKADADSPHVCLEARPAR